MKNFRRDERREGAERTSHEELPEETKRIRVIEAALSSLAEKPLESASFFKEDVDQDFFRCKRGSLSSEKVFPLKKNAIDFFQGNEALKIKVSKEDCLEAMKKFFIHDPDEGIMRGLSVEESKNPLEYTPRLARTWLGNVLREYVSDCTHEYENDILLLGIIPRIEQWEFVRSEGGESYTLTLHAPKIKVPVTLKRRKLTIGLSKKIDQYTFADKRRFALISQEDCNLIIEQIKWLERLLSNIRYNEKGIQKIISSLVVKGKEKVFMYSRIEEEANKNLREKKGDGFLKRDEDYILRARLENLRQACEVKKKESWKTVTFNEKSFEALCTGATSILLESLPGNPVKILEQEAFVYYFFPCTNKAHGGGYSIIPFFAYRKEDRHLFGRIAYLSQSHAQWRVDVQSFDLQGKWNGTFGKGTHGSYTVETLPTDDIEEILVEVQKKSSEESDEIGPFIAASCLDPNLLISEEEIQRDRPLPGIPDRDVFLGFKNDDIKEIIREGVPDDFVPDFSQKPRLTRKHPPTRFFPEGYMIEEYPFTYRKQKIVVKIAYDKDGRVWLRGIARDSAVRTTSYGTRQKFLSCGILNAKPFEYTSQALGLGDLASPYDYQYSDITKFFDLFPIIQAFRSARGIERENTK